MKLRAIGALAHAASSSAPSSEICPAARVAISFRSNRAVS
jgi:hypothetical protein